MLQAQCNMTCDFCITEESLGVKSFDEAMRLIHGFHSDGIRNLVIGGGEPFIWPHDCLKLAREAKQLDFLVQIGTNAVHFPPDFESRPEVDRYVIPLESVAPEPHNAIRKYRRQHHAVIMSCLERLKASRKSVTISTIVTKPNRDHVLAVGEFLRDYHRETEHVHAWHIYQFVPEGRGGRENAPALQLGPNGRDEYDSLFNQARELKLPFKVFKRADMPRSKSVAFY
jgi:MoaA/NifB/PqqE/SkfB family radical SAM enzyme